MDYNEYKEALLCAAETLNERMGTEFSEDNLLLRCFQTENQQEVFEQFCKQYFPDRLEDRYTEDGYFDFHASAFIGKEDGVDGILLRKEKAMWMAFSYAQILNALRQRSFTFFCMSWRISSVPAMSLAETASTNATAWMIH